MMKYKQFEEISVSDLCDRLHIPRKSFYRYFSSKEGALHALLDFVKAVDGKLEIPATACAFVIV